MIDSNHSCHKILTDLSGQRLTILCGAGISYNSGLPVVYQFIEAIFDEFDLSEDERHTFHTSVYPFEAFMEVLEDESDIKPLLEIFRCGSMNTNHLFIAKLVKAGRVRNIVTTNFDLLIEEALSTVGYRKDQDFKVYQSESDFGRLDWTADTINLIKMHGCASDFRNMAINMRLVAGQENCENKVKVIQQLFDKNINPLVLILGYSCSDIFDISPAIETVKENQSTVVLLEHTNRDSPQMEPLNVKLDKNPFQKFFGGTRVFINADTFVKALWKVNDLDEYTVLKPSPPNWRANIAHWYSTSVANNSKGFAHQICGRVFDNTCCYDLSAKHYKIAVNIAFNAADWIFRSMLTPKKPECFGMLK